MHHSRERRSLFPICSQPLRTVRPSLWRLLPVLPPNGIAPEEVYSRKNDLREEIRVMIGRIINHDEYEPNFGTSHQNETGNERFKNHKRPLLGQGQAYRVGRISSRFLAGTTSRHQAGIVGDDKTVCVDPLPRLTFVLPGRVLRGRV
jgi:hypothetical protein